MCLIWGSKTCLMMLFNITQSISLLYNCHSTTNPWPFSLLTFFAPWNKKQTWAQLSIALSLFLSWVLPKNACESHLASCSESLLSSRLSSAVLFHSPGSQIPYSLLLFFYLLFHSTFRSTVVLLWASFIPHVKQCMWSPPWHLIGSCRMYKRTQ